MSIQLAIMPLDFDSNCVPTTTLFPQSEITLGHLPTNDVVLDSPGVSGLHARIRMAETNGHTVLYIADLDSKNGTLVDNVLLAADEEVVLSSSARIIIGNYLIKPTIGPDAPKAEQDCYEFRDELIEQDGESTQAVVVGEQASDNGSEDSEDETDAVEDDEDADLDDWILADAVREVDDAEDEGDVDFDEESDADYPLAGAGEAEVPVDLAVADSGSTGLLSEVKMGASGLFARESSAEEIVEDVAEEHVAHRSTDLLEGSSMDLNGAGTIQSFGIIRGSVQPGLVENIDLLLTPFFVVSGVALHAGKPLAGVYIDGGNLGTTVTDEEGSFVFRQVAGGASYRLQASKDGFAFEPPVFEGEMDGNQAVNFRAVQLFSISGRVTHQGRGLADVTVCGENIGETVTDDDGRFSFSGIAEGTDFRLIAMKSDFTFMSLTRVGTLLEDTAVEFSAVQLFNIRGRLVRNGVPVPNAIIDGGSLGKTITAADGTYSFSGIPEGTEYTLRASLE